MSKFCGNCGAPIADGATVCAGCGAPIKAAQKSADAMEATLPLDLDYNTNATIPLTVPVSHEANRNVTAPDHTPAYPYANRGAEPANTPAYPGADTPFYAGGNASAPNAGGAPNKNILIIAVAAVAIVALIVTCILLLNRDDGGSDRSGDSDRRERTSSVQGRDRDSDDDRDRDEQDDDADERGYGRERTTEGRERTTGKAPASTAGADAAAKKAMDAFVAKDSTALIGMTSPVVFQNGQITKQSMKESYDETFRQTSSFQLSYHNLSKAQILSDNDVYSFFYGFLNDDEISSCCGKLATASADLTKSGQGITETITIYIYLLQDSGGWKLFTFDDGNSSGSNNTGVSGYSNDSVYSDDEYERLLWELFGEDY